MGLLVKSVCFSVHDFLISSLKGPVSLFDCRTVSSSRPFAAPVTPRADAVKDGLLATAGGGLSLTASSTVSRCPGSGPCGPCSAVSRRRTVSPGEARSIRGEPAVSEQRTSPHNLVYGGPAKAPTMMQSCASAAGSGRRLQSTSAAQRPGWASARRHLGSSGQPAPATASGRQAKVLQSSLVDGTKVHGRRRPFRSPPASARRRPAVRRSSRSATARSGSCAPAPRSLSCGYRPGHRWCARDTIAPGRCPSGT